MLRDRYWFVLLSIVVGFVAAENGREQIILVCPGSCVDIDFPCNETVENTDCGDFAKCCLDAVVATESTDFGTPTSPNTVDWVASVSSNEGATVEADQIGLQYEGFTGSSTSEYYREFSETPSATETVPTESYEIGCPGACIPTEHSSLCQYVIQSEYLCGPQKKCCATKESAMKMQYDYGVKEHQFGLFRDANIHNECPGKCIHPSLTLFCDKIMPEYNCPMNSKCCNKRVEASKRPESQLRCTGECLHPHLSYLCLPPYQLIPGTIECAGSSVCCMNTEKEHYISELEVMDETNEQLRALLDSLPSDELPGGVLASDENGQIYYVFQSGQFRPLQTISLVDAMSENYAHYSDVQVQTGRVSLFRDVNGLLYQLADSEESTGLSNEELSYKDSHQVTESSVQSSTVSMPDIDGMQESLKDIVLTEEGNQIETKNSIPPGERTLIKPQCPGTCISSYLKFTCIRNSAAYDGFTCPARSVCCANIRDIEKHEQYLESLSPYFKASVSTNQNGITCGVKGNADKSGTVTAREWCWQAAIINGQNQYVCGAVIIDNSWVLTAASCVTGALNGNEALYIRAGVTDLTKTDNRGIQTRVLSIFVHHNYNSMSLENNIALLHLQSPLQVQENVCVICLPLSGIQHKSVECTVTGYGFISEAGVMSLKLSKAMLPLVDDLDCIANVSETLRSVFILPPSSLCAGGHGSLAYQGDAGGPLVCKQNDKYDLVGLLSWGLGYENEDVPSIYVKVASFTEWITQIIGANAFLKALS